MAKAYSRIGINLPTPPLSNDKSELIYYAERMDELGKLQSQIKRYLDYRLFIEWKDDENDAIEVGCIRLNSFNTILSGKNYIYQYRRNSDSVMETELNPPSNIVDEFLEIYNFIKAENVFVCSTDGETDDIILARNSLDNDGYEYELIEIVFHSGRAKIRQGVIKDFDGCLFTRSKKDVRLDDVLDTINDTSRELKDILNKYILH